MIAAPTSEAMPLAEETIALGARTGLGEAACAFEAVESSKEKTSARDNRFMVPSCYQLVGCYFSRSWMVRTSRVLTHRSEAFLDLPPQEVQYALPLASLVFTP